MAEFIHFDCPACGTPLRLPLALAASQGPCPRCGRGIVAPDPEKGIGASQVAEPDPPLPAAEKVETAFPDPAGGAKSQRGVLVLSCLLTGLVALVWGYALGVRAGSAPAKIPPAAAPAVPKIEMAPVPPPEVEPPPRSVSAAAEASLRAFLQAPDWAARAAHVLHAEQLRGAMETYARENGEGPVPFDSISVKQSHIDRKSGFTLYLFYVVTGKFPEGIPVAVQETSAGWLVDWQAFVEFRDGLFGKFADGPADRSGSFHLAVTAVPAERAAKSANERFSSCMLQAPLSTTARLAFVKKDSPAATLVAGALAGGEPFMPVLEVAKRKAADGQTYLEVTRVLATDWLPAE